MKRLCSLLLMVILLSSCASRLPLATVDYVDIEKFMGDWYVIANIPTFVEVDAYNAVESYSRNADGTIATTFSFLDGGFSGKQKRYYPKGFIKDKQSNALWGMQFVWPFKADYRIIHLANDYSTTIIGRKARDFVWIMARNSQISEQEYRALIDKVELAGYDISKVRRIPQQWPAS